MSKGDTFEDDFLSLILTATAIADLAQDDGSSPATTLTIALHTADPGEAGTQATSEATYTSYARVTVARTTAGWTVTSGVGSNDNAITFPQCTGGSNTITHFSVGTGVSNKLLWSGALNASLAVSNLITPSFAAGALTITET